MIHQIKTWPQYFSATWNGKKNFELRFNDRNYKVGDKLILKEWDQENELYTGHHIRATITFILGEFPGLKEKYVILGIEITERK